VELLPGATLMADQIPSCLTGAPPIRKYYAGSTFTQRSPARTAEKSSSVISAIPSGKSSVKISRAIEEIHGLGENRPSNLQGFEL
jgi:hypothetical protein